MKPRYNNLDFAKGIGIILVVWGHANGPCSQYIYQFHMPLFFFISGMLFCNSQNDSWEAYALRKLKSLLVPFWKYNFLFFPIFYVLYYWNEWNGKDLISWLLRILFTVDKVPFLGPTWFLASLFWVSIIVKEVVAKFEKNSELMVMLLGTTISIFGFYINLPYH